MSSFLQNPWLTLICRLIVSALFLFASITKIGDPAGFATTVARYELMPSMANLIGMLFPWIELVLALALLCGVWPRAASIGIAALVALFIVAMIWALAHGLKISCGCFGNNEPLTMWTLLRDALIALPVIQLLISRSHRWGICEG